MGYVGCVTAACLSRDGHQVIGVDVDQGKIASLEAGVPPVSEPGLAELIANEVSSRRLRATCDVAQAVEQSEMALVAVGTPSAADGSVETRALERVMQSLGEALRGVNRPYAVVVRSTLLPGILEDRLAPILEKSAGCELGGSITLCNHPEFLRETTAIRDYDRPPFILVGASETDSAQKVFELYEKIEAERLIVDTRTAALVKYACNAFHALKVSFANEIGTLARQFGADGQEVMRLLCKDTRLNVSPAYLRPGYAFGGSCLPKDVRALVRFAQQQAIDTALLNAIVPSNDAHIDRSMAMIREAGCRRIGLAGLSFKAGTDDLRESPLVILAESLLGRGYELKIYDPGVHLTRLVGRNLAYVDTHLPHLAALLVEDAGELVRHAELLVLGTDVANGIDWQTLFTGEIIDLRRDLVVAAAPVPVGT
jgi:GDP-mannose 6-dehydrogenase